MASEVQANVWEKFCVLGEKEEIEVGGLDVKNLPVEVVLNIFNRLSLRDLSSVILVSRLWRDIGLDPGLWKQFALRVKGGNLTLVRSMLANTRFSSMEIVKISDNFWNKLMPEQIQNLVREISVTTFVRRIFLSLERDVLETPDTEKSKALIGEMPPNVKLTQADLKILQIRPVRLGRNITYKYRVQFLFQLSLL
eukprot:GFUD01008155.1.p1 GENE.GFUD01008155.1~~GFUD01008155.1.p1  ORF type:complete len:195 (+),score=48.14 GFUD01008155.1:210-794(+)